MARTARLFVLVVAGGLLVPSTAAAHLRSGTTAVDYRARVTSPPSPAFAARVYQSDRALHVVVRSGHTLVVLGYLGEPFLRIDASGVTVAATSPTAASTHAIFGTRVLTRRRGTTRACRAFRLARTARAGVWRSSSTADEAPSRASCGVPRPSWWLWGRCRDRCRRSGRRRRAPCRPRAPAGMVGRARRGRGHLRRRRGRLLAERVRLAGHLDRERGRSDLRARRSRRARVGARLQPERLRAAAWGCSRSPSG